MRICAILSHPCGFGARFWCGALIGFLLAPAALALEPEAELRETREAIQDLERSQEDRSAALQELEALLAEAARGTEASRRELRELARARSRQESVVADQEARVAEARDRLEAERQAAARLVRDQWQRERHPGRTDGQSRDDRHHAAFAARIREAREQALVVLRERIEALEAAREELARERAVLAEQEAQARAAVADLEREEARRRQAMAELEAAIEDEALELERLQRNAATLEAVIEEVEARSAARAAAPRESAPARPDVAFAELEGELPRPAEGRIIRSFNESRGSRLRSRWRGAVLEVDNGAAVRAVHYGRVVYADWMQGYGFLVIVDHGERYLTLYSNVEEILVAEGETVGAGEQLAVAGEGSEAIAPGLYFEIRHNGGPLNPEGWWPSQ
ncbi:MULTISPECIES: murein hydrolase activator EnvC [unclassified Thioalkalivibrio]|uniref:murein hydrolase activator EnvC family protein n=1 Tax=unclassified Thioalkalivibrio TaxID=2621013 RepID=UPI00036CF381|nr:MULTISPECIES: peptidoglycan DD-metalloendopeptidase family protein [unclassified Thioalkalivibrio]